MRGPDIKADFSRFATKSTGHHDLEIVIRNFASRPTPLRLKAF
jgi:hypothetical protein